MTLFGIKHSMFCHQIVEVLKSVAGSTFQTFHTMNCLPEITLH